LTILHEAIPYSKSEEFDAEGPEEQGRESGEGGNFLCELPALYSDETARRQ
jgi:hypothetical protein